MKKLAFLLALFCLPALAQSSSCTLTSGALSCDPALPDAPYTASFTVTPLLCGPPKYPCSRSDLKVAQTPKLEPPGAANAIVTDPDFGNRILRATDAHTTPVGKNLAASKSGGDGDRMVNLDSTLFAVADSGGRIWFLDFDVNKFRIPHPIPTAYIGGFAVQFSHFSNNVAFVVRGSQLLKLTFPIINGTVSSASFTQALLFDFAKCPGIPQPFVPPVGATLRGDDDHLVTAFGTLTGQDNKTIVAAWYNGKGCSWLNSASGEVKGDFGATGTIPNFTAAMVHDTAASQDGKYASISWVQDGAAAWEVGTLNLVSCTNACGGHAAQGYGRWLHLPGPKLNYRTWDKLDTPIPFVSLPGVGGENHYSWNNNTGDDAECIVGATALPNQTWTAALQNEVWGGCWNGSLRRFAHTFASGASTAGFSSQYAIGTVSPDGKFFFFSSDWLGATGRSDVYIVELQ